MNSLPAENPPLYSEPLPTPAKGHPRALGEASTDAQPSKALRPSQPASQRKSLGQPVALLTSAALHCLALLLLSLLLFQLPAERPQAWLQGAFDDETETLELDVNELASAGGELSGTPDQATALLLTENLTTTQVVEPARLELPITTAPSDRAASVSDAMRQPLASLGGGLEGRKLQNRRSLALAGGSST